MVIDTELRDWQTRLKQHFTALRDRRCSDGSERPVFGLEHGLCQRDIKALATAVRAYIAAGPPSQEHSLAWIVYSSELGYGYSGDEYWQTFEQETQGWILNGDRYWIRNCYRQFQREFGGAVPSGAWAKHFSIICWPITHAVLPKDLQIQFARILYELRYFFSGELLDSPSMLGKLIATRCWNATSRFQNLAQETQFVGQIAAALLLEDDFGSDNLIHSATLRRISADLDRERRAREWLKGARRFAKESVQVRGLSLPGRHSTAPAISHLDEARAEITALGIEPRLVLRPLDSERNFWRVSLEIPDLSHLLVRFPRTREILTGSRCVVAGASGRPLARGRCLHGAQRVTLARWPRTDEVLLQFEQANPQLEYLLRTECLLRPGTTWLFRIASDGLAYESRSLRVRPGERYLVVSTKEPLVPSEHVRAIDLRCEGADGVLLDIPPALTSAWEETLHRLGLGQAKTIEVWPAGLAAGVWDGEGHGEWLASEQPCLAIRVDHPVEGLSVSVGQQLDSLLELNSIKSGEPVFLELSDLSPGLHRIRISARTSPEAEPEALGDLDVVMRILAGRPWSPRVNCHGSLDIQMEPPAPSLEQLWEGGVEITIRGPTGRNVACRVSLYEKEGEPTIATKQLPPMSLPVSTDGWRNHFEKHFRTTKNAEDAYDVARICELEFTADELGAFSVRCEREFTPLRWSTRRRGQDYVVRLLDDSGDDDHPTVTRLTFETPAFQEPIGYDSEYDAPASGGMYVARLRQFTAAIIVLPSVIRGLDDLGCTPHIDTETRSLESIVRLLSIAQLWGRARLPGAFLAVSRRREVLLALGRHTTWLICGENWARAERALHEGAADMTRLKEAVSRRPDEMAIGVVLARDYADLAAKTCGERVERIASIATRFHLLSSATTADECDARWLTEFALRVACDPAGVEEWAGERLRAGLTRLMELPTLARATRFLVLAIHQHFSSRTSADELYTGWDW